MRSEGELHAGSSVQSRQQPQNRCTPDAKAVCTELPEMQIRGLVPCWNIQVVQYMSMSSALHCSVPTA